MRAEALLTLVQWLSPVYPTGGFAWSHGLEAAVAEGWVSDAEGLERWLADLLRLGAGRTDAILLAAAWREEDPGAAAELAEALAPSMERRAETLEQGAAFARTTRAVWGLDLPDMALPVAVGRAARLAGLPVEPVSQVFLQSFVSAQVQAALRLMPLGQTAGQGVLHRLSPLCAAVAEEAVAAGLDDIGGAALGLDLAAMRHEVLPSRIFRS